MVVVGVGVDGGVGGGGAVGDGLGGGRVVGDAAGGGGAVGGGVSGALLHLLYQAHTNPGWQCVSDLQPSPMPPCCTEAAPIRTWARDKQTGQMTSGAVSTAALRRCHPLKLKLTYTHAHTRVRARTHTYTRA